MSVEQNIAGLSQMSVENQRKFYKENNDMDVKMLELFEELSIDEEEEDNENTISSGDDT